MVTGENHSICAHCEMEIKGHFGAFCSDECEQAHRVAERLGAVDQQDTWSFASATTLASSGGFMLSTAVYLNVNYSTNLSSLSTRF